MSSSSTINNPIGSPHQALLIIARYHWWAFPFGLLSMAIFRFPLFFNKSVSFYRLMGSGKSGSFDKTPDLWQWAILAVFKQEKIETYSLDKEQNNLITKLLGNFISIWISLFCKTTTIYGLSPMEGHGLWNGKAVFGTLPRKGAEWNGQVAVLTRATIRPGKAHRFWAHVDAVSAQMAAAPGFITSYGIGEIPWLKQATFSIWESMDAMRNFAYSMPKHREVVKLTHQEKWYSEEMFVRFKILFVLKNGESE